jgi:MraZ protein
MMALSSFDKRSSGLQRLLVGHAEDVELDSAGRLLISPTLREFARLEKQVMLVGQGTRFELWNMEAWLEQQNVAMADNEMDLPPALEDFSL